MLFVDVGHFLARLLVIILGNERLSGAFPANTTVANDSHGRYILRLVSLPFRICGWARTSLNMSASYLHKVSCCSFD